MTRPFSCADLALACLLAATATRAEERTAEQLCADLGCEEVDVREVATTALIAQGTSARPAVLAAWRESKDPEVQARALEVLQGIDTQELIRLLTSFDACGEPRPPQPPEIAPSDPPVEDDVAVLLAKLDSEDWRAAEHALHRLNHIAEGAIFDPPTQDWSEAPDAVRQLAVLVGRDCVARGLASWGRLLGASPRSLPPTVRPLGRQDVEALIAADPGDVTKSRPDGRPELRKTAGGGLFTYRYATEAPHYPIERIAPNGVVHQFTFDTATGELVAWRVDRIGDESIDILLVHGRVGAIRTSTGPSITFR